jgi:EpsI family protein
MRPNVRFLSTVLLLSGVATFLQARAGNERFPPREPLPSLPFHLGEWEGIDEPISPAVLQVLGKGEFLQRAYLYGSETEPVQLFIAYFPSQRTGDTIHSPQNCLPGSGWSPLESTRIVLTVPGHVPFQANRYLIGKGEDQQLVLYWYWSHDRAEASEYWAKFHLVEDAIRLNRSDGALIRISTTLHAGEPADTAQSRTVDFAGKLVPKLDNYLPR